MKRNEKLEVRNGNLEFNLVCFFTVHILLHSSSMALPFKQGGSSVIVRRSDTCGYESYCLSGKGKAVNGRPRLRWIFVFDDVFWLGKPNFHNRRIHSAGLINIGNLPGRQNIRYS